MNYSLETVKAQFWKKCFVVEIAAPLSMKMAIFLRVLQCAHTASKLRRSFFFFWLNKRLRKYAASQSEW